MPQGTPISIGFYPNSASPVDERYLNNGVAYATTSEVISTIPTISRYAGLTVNVVGIEYWFWPDVNTLVPKIGTITIADGSITNAKLANMTGYTIKGKKTVGTGTPEDIPLATLRTDLNIPADPTTALSNKVDKVVGSTLLSSAQATIIANQSNINTGDETQTTILNKLGVSSVLDGTSLSNALNGKQNTEAGKGLSTNDYTPADKAVVSKIVLPYKLHFGAYADISARIANSVSGIDYPLTFTISVSSPGGLKIVHNLAKDVSVVSVWSIDINGKRQERNSAAYTGLLCPDINTLIIEGIATVLKAIDVYIQFV